MKTFHRILCSVFSLSIFAAATLTVKAATPISVTAWGAGATSTAIEPEYGQSIIPAGLTGSSTSDAGQVGLTSTVSGGLYHSLAVKYDGSVVAWGYNGYAQSTVPNGLSTVSALATFLANPAGTLATATITVSTAVSNSIVAGMKVTGPTGTVGAGATVVSKATAAGVTTLTLSVPNAVSLADATGYILISPFSPVAAVAAGGFHSLALKADGSVLAWGAGTTAPAAPPVAPQFGQAIVPLGLVTLYNVGATIPNNTTGLVNTVTLAAANTGVVPGMLVTGPANTVGIGAKVVSVSGTTVTLTVPNLNSPVTPTPSTPVALNFYSGVVAIAAGYYHSVALKSDGSVVVWGGDTTNVPTIQTVPAGLSPILAVANVPPNPNPPGTVNTVTLAAPNAGIIPGMLVTGPAGTVGSGAIVLSKTGTPALNLTLSVPNAVNTNAANITTALTFPPPSIVIAIAAGNEHTMALKSDGTVVTWGRNVEGQTAGINPFTAAATLPGVPFAATASLAFPANSVVTLSAANASIVPGMFVSGPAGTVGAGATVLSNVGTIVTLSVPNVNPAAAAGVTLTFTPPLANNTVTLGAVNPAIVPGMYVTGAVSTVGAGAKVVSIDPTGLILTLSMRNAYAATTPSAVTLTFSTGIVATAIAAGGDTSYALKDDTTVVAWGDNFNGQTSIPAGLTGVTAISAGGDHALALKSDSTVQAWGKIWNGSVYLAETVPAGLTGVTTISAGGYHSLAIGSPPLITTPPATVTVPLAGTATLFAGNYLAASYQWQKNGVNIDGATNPTLTLTNVQAADFASYTAIITTSTGSIISSPTILSGLSGSSTVSIVTQPVSVTPNAGGTATFSVVASGGSIYQWYKDGVALTNGTTPAGTIISGATSSVLTLSNLQAADVGTYTVKVSNNAGDSVTSNPATLVMGYPVITSQPLSYIAQQPGGSATFDVQATGAATLLYQWKRNGVSLANGLTAGGSTVAGATTNVLTLTNVTTADVGSYSVVVTNSLGSVSSKIASLKVVPTSVIIKPTITSSLATISLTKGTLMAPTYTITANTPSPVFSVKGLPKGLKLNSKTGVISGKPSKTGIYLVTLQAKSKNAGMASATKYFQVNP
jgi:alpha-tubulin suppressor-like RCC1 family protein